jgi:hypothetical protein
VVPSLLTNGNADKRYCEDEKRVCDASWFFFSVRFFSQPQVSFSCLLRLKNRLRNLSQTFLGQTVHRIPMAVGHF